jgi:hypothetical protein
MKTQGIKHVNPPHCMANTKEINPEVFVHDHKTHVCHVHKMQNAWNRSFEEPSL